MIATEMDPDTHCAAIVISTSDDPQARQLSTIVMNSSLVLDVLNSGDFSMKKMTRIASDALRSVLYIFLCFKLLMDGLRGRAAELAAADLKKGVRGNAAAQDHSGNGGSKDAKV